MLICSIDRSSIGSIHYYGYRYENCRIKGTINFIVSRVGIRPLFSHAYRTRHFVRTFSALGIILYLYLYFKFNCI